MKSTTYLPSILLGNGLGWDHYNIKKLDDDLHINMNLLLNIQILSHLHCPKEDRRKPSKLLALGHCRVIEFFM